MIKASGSRGRGQFAGLKAFGTAAVCLALSLHASALSQSQPGKPIIVRIPQDPPKSELSGLADVLLGSLGLTGVIVVAAVTLGAVMAGVMFWVRSREP
jgi:ABC-type phosphate transport system permease subunit